MTSLRDRIESAIVAHEPCTDYECSTGECIECDLNPRWPDALPTEPTDGWKLHAAHVADAVMAVIREANDDIRPTLREALASWNDDADERHHPNCGELSIPDVLYRCQSCGNGMEWCGCRYYCKRCEPAWSKRA